MRVFLTGGTGYFGQRLVAGLIGAGHAVTALVRSRTRALPLETLGADLVVGDVTDFAAVKADLVSYDAFIHSAALVKTRAADPSEFDRVNVNGVANVARRCLEARILRFIYTSSFIALGPASGRVPLDEHAEHDPGHIHNDYERTKYLGLLEYEHWLSRGLPGVALFPCVIYGPGTLTSGNLTASIIADLVLGRLPGVLGDGQSTWTYSFVEDVVEGHIQALAKARPGERYILGGESLSMDEFVALVAQVASVRAPRRHIPFALAKVAAFIEETLATIRRREPKLTRQVVEIYKHNWVYSSAKAKRELGYTVTPLKTALAQTVDWVKMAVSEGKIK